VDAAGSGDTKFAKVWKFRDSQNVDGGAWVGLGQNLNEDGIKAAIAFSMCSRVQASHDRTLRAKISALQGEPHRVPTDYTRRTYLESPLAT
jgi:hypothetical protein